MYSISNSLSTFQRFRRFIAIYMPKMGCIYIYELENYAQKLQLIDRNAQSCS